MFGVKLANTINKGGCFHPNSRILMADKSIKHVGKVRKGDLVSCGDERVASVRCVTFSTGIFEMVDLDGFSLTSTHPVRSSENEWYIQRILHQIFLSTMK